MAIAMTSIPVLANLLDCPALLVYEEPETWFQKRDEIKAILAGHLNQKQTIDWLAILEPADIWCADVLNWNQLLNKNGFKELNMLQTVEMSDAYTYQTTRCPISINGEQFQSIKAAPHLGENTKAISEEFGL
jgi:CoA:oxalate CoA-transferase